MPTAPTSASDAASPYSIPTKSSTASGSDPSFSFITDDNAAPTVDIPGAWRAHRFASGRTERRGCGGGGPPAGRRAARQLAGGVEVPQRLRVRLEQGGLAVRHLARGAERGDQRLRPVQAGPRHGGEEVVLDLVIEAAEGEVGQPAAVDVARRQHLTAQEVGLVVRGQDRHPLVVGSERRAQVEAEQALLHDDEDDRL